MSEQTQQEVYSRNMRASTSVGDLKEDVHAGVGAIMLVGERTNTPKCDPQASLLLISDPSAHF